MKSNKFKVWDKQEKCWVPEAAMITSDGVLHIDVADREWMPPGDGDRFVICWDTGLHDKSGKEIYEGDVVKTSAGQGCVEWAEDTACFEVIDGVGSRSLYGYLKERNGVKVIGNRFENPQLVEGKG